MSAQNTDSLFSFISQYSEILFGKDGFQDSDNLKNVIDFFIILYQTENLTKQQFKQGIKELSSFLNKASTRICSFFDNEQLSNLLVSFLIQTTDSPFSEYINKEIMNIINSFLLNKYEKHPYHVLIYPFFSKIIGSEKLFCNFIEFGCLKSALTLSMRDGTIELNSLIFQKISKQLDTINHQQAISFLLCIAESLSVMNPNSAPPFLDFLAAFIVKNDILKEFYDSKGFDNLNQFIIKDPLRKGLIIYQNTVSDSQKIHINGEYVVLKKLLILLQTLAADDFESKVKIFQIILKYIEIYPDTSIPLDEKDFAIIQNINKDEKVYDIFFDICFFMSSKFKVEPKTIIRSIAQYTFPEFVLSNNVPKLFRLLTFLTSCEHNISFELLYGLFGTGKIESFINILCKYEGIANRTFARLFLHKSTLEDQTTLLTKFLTSGLDEINYPVFSQTFSSILEIPSMPEMMIGFVASFTKNRKVLVSILRSFTDFALREKKYRTTELRTGLIYLIQTISPQNQEEKIAELNLISALSGRVFNKKYDSLISNHMRSVNFYNSTELEIQKLCFGILQHEDLDPKHQHICFPSLLSHCGNIIIFSQYDLFICAIYGIDKWIAETGLSISKFPCIDQISKRYITSKQIGLLLEEPLSCINSFSDSILGIPLFEFTRSFEGSTFKIELSNQQKEPHPSITKTNSQNQIILDQNDKIIEKQYNHGISLWFMLSESTQTSQRIIQYHSIMIHAIKSSLYCNETKIINIQNNKWYNIFIFCSDTSNIRIYLNSSFIYKIQGNELGIIEIGSDDVYINWFVGGSIRILENIPTQITSILQSIAYSNTTYEFLDKEIALIYQNGVKCISSLSQYETQNITANDFVNFETGEIYRKEISPNTMPVIFNPISAFTTLLFDNQKGLFNKLYNHMFKGNFEKAREIFILLTFIPKTKYLNHRFILMMSSLMHLFPRFMTKDIFDPIIQCFYLKEGFDFFNFLEFILDPGLYQLPIAEHVIALLKNMILNFETKLTNSLMEKFERNLIFQILQTKNDKVRFIAFDIFKSYIKECNEIAKYISLINDFKNEQTCITINDSKETDFNETLQIEDVFPSFIQLLYSTINKEFNSFDILQCLDSEYRLQIIFQYIKQFENCQIPEISNNDDNAENKTFNIKNFIVHTCLNDCYNITAWSIIMSLIIKSPVDFNQTVNFEFDEVATEYLPYFFLMMSVLLSIHQYLDPKWESIVNYLLDFIKLISSDITLNDFVLFSISQMLSFGLYSNGFVKYPWAPSFTEVSSVQCHSFKRGQNFPQDIAFVDFTPSNQPSKIHIVKNDIFSRIPEHQKIWFHNPDYQYNSKEYIDSIVNDSFPHIQKKLYCKNWSELFNKLRNKFLETLNKEHSKINKDENEDLSSFIPFLDVVQFVVNILIDHFHDPDFIRLLEKLTLSSGMMHPKQGKLVLQKIILNLLTECSSRNYYNAEMITFISNRIFEGWLSNSYAPILALILHIIRNCNIEVIPQNILGMLLMGFELVQKEQYHIFVELFVTYNDYIFSSLNMNKPQFVILMLDRIIVHYNILPESFNVVLGNFYLKLKDSQQIQDKWNEDALTNSLLFEDLLNIAQIFSSGSLESFQQWIIENKEKSIAFEKIRISTLEKFSQKNIKHLNQTIDAITQIRYLNMDKFNDVSNSLLFDISKQQLISISYIKYITRYINDAIIADFSYFYRERENFLFDLIGFSSKDHEYYDDNSHDTPFTTQTRDSPFNSILLPSYYKFTFKEVLDNYTEKNPIKELELLRNYNIKQKLQIPLYLNTTKVQNMFLSFSLPIDINPYIRKYVIHSILIQNTSKHGAVNEPIQESFLVTSQSMILFDTSLIDCEFFATENQLLFIPGITSPQKFIDRIISGWYGAFSVFEGIPVIIVDLKKLARAAYHSYSSDSQCISITLFNGVSFIFSFIQKEIVPQVVEILKKATHYSFNCSPPNIPFVYSTSNFCRLLSKPFIQILEMWLHSDIDNLLLISCLNVFANRSFCDITQFPFYPRLNTNSIHELIPPTYISVIKGESNKDKEEYLPQEIIYNQSNVISLQNTSKILKWISEVFTESSKAAEHNKPNIFKQGFNDIIPPQFENKFYDDFNHIMKNPNQIFWYHIKNLNRISNGIKTLMMSDDSVFTSETISFILPPTYKCIVSLDSLRNQLILSDPFFSPKTLKKLAIIKSRAKLFSISDDYLYFSIGYYNNSFQVGTFVFNSNDLTKIQLNDPIFIDDEPSFITISSLHFLVFVSCSNIIYRISIPSNSIWNDEIVLDYKVNYILIDDFAGNLIAIGDNIITILSFDGEELKRIEASKRITSAAKSLMPLGMKNRFFVTGHTDSSISFWSNGECIKVVETRLSDIQHIAIDSQNQRIAFSSNDKLYILSYFGNNSKPLIDEHAQYCAKCGKTIEKKPYICRKCHRFFCVNCYQKRFSLIKNTDWICSDCNINENA